MKHLRWNRWDRVMVEGKFQFRNQSEDQVEEQTWELMRTAIAEQVRMQINNQIVREIEDSISQ